MTTSPITIVTGGAGGIGLACVRRLSSLGHQVVVLDLPGTRSETEMNAWGVRAFTCDINDESAARNTAEQINTRHDAG